MKDTQSSFVSPATAPVVVTETAIPDHHNQIRMELPGRIIKVDNDGRGIVIELTLGGKGLIHGSNFDSMTSQLSLEQREELYTKLNRQVTIELIRATLCIR